MTDSESSDASTAELPPHFFDIYKIAIDMADKVSARRGRANTFFATANAALVALIGTSHYSDYVAIAGVLLTFVWMLMLKSYRDLNEAKFFVIGEMETRLPARIFTDEWARLKQEPIQLRIGSATTWLAQYRELGTVEKLVPWLFLTLYAVVLINGHRA